MLLLIGIPVSCVIAVETQYAVWGISLSILLICMCCFLAIKTADLYAESDKLIFKRPIQGKISTVLSEIKKVKRLRSGKHTYIWFETTKGNFIVIAPMWGDEREALFTLYGQLSPQ